MDYNVTIFRLKYDYNYNIIDYFLFLLSAGISPTNLIFFYFLKNYPLKSDNLGLMNSTCCCKLPRLSGYTQFFLQKK